MPSPISNSYFELDIMMYVAFFVNLLDIFQGNVSIYLCIFLLMHYLSIFITIYQYIYLFVYLYYQMQMILEVNESKSS